MTLKAQNWTKLYLLQITLEAVSLNTLIDR